MLRQARADYRQESASELRLAGPPAAAGPRRRHGFRPGAGIRSARPMTGRHERRRRNGRRGAGGLLQPGVARPLRCRRAASSCHWRDRARGESHGGEWGEVKCSAAATRNRAVAARGPRPKHVPQRTCVVCREHDAKRGLTRIVRSRMERSSIDPTRPRTAAAPTFATRPACWEQAASTDVLARRSMSSLPQEFRRRASPIRGRRCRRIDAAARRHDRKERHLMASTIYKRRRSARRRAVGREAAVAAGSLAVAPARSPLRRNRSGRPRTGRAAPGHDGRRACREDWRPRRSRSSRS